MSKSIKFKNNVYLDSDSIVYGRTLLSTLLSGRFATRMSGTLYDGQTKTWTLESWGAYLFINAHCYRRSIALITNYGAMNRFNVDVIFNTEGAMNGLPTFSFDANTNVLTAVSATGQQMRGNLFELNVIL